MIEGDNNIKSGLDPFEGGKSNQNYYLLLVIHCFFIKIHISELVGCIKIELHS